jgi:uroporphyrin-III C-methyltransferase
MTGKVYLVGSGPGDPELLTLKALRVLGAADLVLHDDLVSDEILDLAPPAARVQSVGKRHGPKTTTQGAINATLIDSARAGLTVVRLKGGDPLIFGRAGEEIDALGAAGVDVEIVPGVTAAAAAAASAAIPLTDRRHASALVLLTGHRCETSPAPDWRALIRLNATIAVYMPGERRDELAAELADAGMDPYTPCLLVSRATMPDEQRHRVTLEELKDAPSLPSPVLLIIGGVAATAGVAQPVRAAVRSRSAAP